jgi:hypothetical protein
MAQIANVQYFYNYCNRKLGTNYNVNYSTSKLQAINLYWTTKAVQKVYNDIHKPKSGCRLHLSTRFNFSESNSAALVAVDTTFVHTVVNYLTNFNRVCDTDCECPCSINNATTCDTCSTCNLNTCNTCFTCNTGYVTCLIVPRPTY